MRTDSWWLREVRAKAFLLPESNDGWQASSVKRVINGQIMEVDDLDPVLTNKPKGRKWSTCHAVYFMVITLWFYGFTGDHSTMNDQDLDREPLWLPTVLPPVYLSTHHKQQNIFSLPVNHSTNVMYHHALS